MANTKLTLSDRADQDYTLVVTSTTTTEDPTFITMVIDETATREAAYNALDKARQWITENL